MSRRTSVSGDFSARKRRTPARSSSCSSLKAKFMQGLLCTSPPAAQPVAGIVAPLGGVVYQTQGLSDQKGPGLCHAGAMGELQEIWSDARAEIHQIVVGPMD